MPFINTKNGYIKGFLLSLFSFFFYIVINTILLHIEYVIFLKKIIYYPIIYGIFCPAKPLFSSLKLGVLFADSILKFGIFYCIIRLLGTKNILHSVFAITLLFDFTYVLLSFLPINVDFYFHSSRNYLVHSLFGYSNFLIFSAFGILHILYVVKIGGINSKTFVIYMFYTISSFFFQFLVIHYVLKIPIPS